MAGASKRLILSAVRFSGRNLSWAQHKSRYTPAWRGGASDLRCVGLEGQGETTLFSEVLALGQAVSDSYSQPKPSFWSMEWGELLAELHSTVKPGAFDLLGFYSYDNGMSRPLKDPELRMDFDLRIPLTAAQKKLIVDAARADQSDVAVWARRILVDAARQIKNQAGIMNGVVATNAHG